MQVMVGGHTHVQMMRQHEGRLIINAGSVGMPFKKTPFEHSPRIMPWAEYTILTAVNGVLSVDLRRVPVDMAAIAQTALESKMPERQDWVNNWELSARLL
jgi:diadenosine tetraphosphatase ApaH/serine/threonine PP2A family protein phosphatase